MKLGWKTCFKVGASVFILYLCIRYWTSVEGFVGAFFGAAMPLLIGCAAAYIINIIMSFYERHYFPKTKKPALVKSRRSICLFASYLTLIAIAVLVIMLIVPQLASCVKLIFAELPGVMKSLLAWVKELGILPEDIMAFLESIDWKSRINSFISVLISGIGDVAGMLMDTVSSVFSGIVTAFLSIIFSIYLLSGKDTLRRQLDRVFKRYVREERYAKIKYVLSVLNDCFHRYIVGQCTEAVILGVLCMIGMLILRLPYAAMIGSLIAFTALIPVAGAYIGGGIGALMIFTVSPVKAVIFVIFLVVLQQLEGNLIYPRVVGSSMGLPGIWVLTAVTLGGGVMGILGMLVSVPLAAAFYRLLKNDVCKSEKNKSDEKNVESAKNRTKK